MDIFLNPIKIEYIDGFIEYILEGEWSEEKQEMAIAFEEAFVNICHYAYPNNNGGVRVSIEKNTNSIQVNLWDEGIPYDPTKEPLKKVENHNDFSFQELQIGGHGVRLMREYCELSYERVEGKNHLTMFKKLKKG